MILNQLEKKGSLIDIDKYIYIFSPYNNINKLI